MTDDDRPVPTTEEMKTAVASLDLKLARIFRARLGLAAAEPEPPAPTAEPEPSMAEPVAAPDPDIKPAVPAIDPAARRRPEAELNEKAGAEAEPEAACADAGETITPPSATVSPALAPYKARVRRLSPVKRRLEANAVRVMQELPDEVIYQHSVLCQTVLPYRDPGPEIRIWERQQGQVTLSLEAGRIRGPEGRHIPVGLPFGVYARRALLYLNTEALRTRDRTIDVDGGATAFTRRILCRVPNGREIHQSKDALSRLAGCNVSISYDAGTRAVQINARIVTAFDLWEEHHEMECCLAPKTVVLSADYFQNLMEHAVPLDERAVAALAHSAMGLDVYMWLAQRLHRVDPQRAQFIPWTALYAQFGQGYDRIRKFKEIFLGVLKVVKTQYPEARVKIDKGGMLLAKSPPPVPPRHAILLPFTKPPES